MTAYSESTPIRSGLWRAWIVWVGCFLFAADPLPAQPIQGDFSIRFQVEELPVRLKVGYAVRLLDMNNDQQLDIAFVDSKRVLWLENPTWREHVIYATPDAKFDNVCFAPHDVNGDGRVDFALGADWQFGNSDSGGTIGWLEQPDSGPWIYHPIASEPTTHRMNWVTFRESYPSLIVAPLKGRGTRQPGFEQRGVRLLEFRPPAFATGGTSDDALVETWDRSVITEQLHVMHNFVATDLDDDGQQDLVCASYEGATWIRLDAAALPSSDGWELASSNQRRRRVLARFVSVSWLRE